MGPSVKAVKPRSINIFARCSPQETGLFGRVKAYFVPNVLVSDEEQSVKAVRSVKSVEPRSLNIFARSSPQETVFSDASRPILSQTC